MENQSSLTMEYGIRNKHTGDPNWLLKIASLLFNLVLMNSAPAITPLRLTALTIQVSNLVQNCPMVHCKAKPLSNNIQFLMSQYLEIK